MSEPNEFDMNKRNLGCNHAEDDDLSTEKCATCANAADCFVKEMLTEGVKELSERHATLPLRVVASKSYGVEAIMNLLLDDASTKAKCDLLTLAALLFKNISVIEGFEMKVAAGEYIKDVQACEENSPYGFCHTAKDVCDALGITKEVLKESSQVTSKLIESLIEQALDKSMRGPLTAIKATIGQMDELFQKHLEAEIDLTLKSLVLTNLLRKIYMGTITFKLTN